MSPIVVATRHAPDYARLTVRLSDGRRVDIEYVERNDALAKLAFEGASAQILALASIAIVSADEVFRL